LKINLNNIILKQINMESENHIYLASNEEILFDFNYRYKIIKPTFETMNKKGKILTILSNLEIFSQQLEFDVNILLKIISLFLSCESGIVKETNMYYLKGKYDSELIIVIICNFIKKYLLCKECDKPEVELKTNKNEIKQICKACGHEHIIEYDNKIYDVILKKLKK
jgi:translation initiation factor 5